jgi:hypothetical protein
MQQTQIDSSTSPVQKWRSSRSKSTQKRKERKIIVEVLDPYQRRICG